MERVTSRGISGTHCRAHSCGECARFSERSLPLNLLSPAPEERCTALNLPALAEVSPASALNLPASAEHSPASALNFERIPFCRAAAGPEGSHDAVMHGAKRNMSPKTIGHVSTEEGHRFTRALFCGGGGSERHRLTQAHGGYATYRSGQAAVHVASRCKKGLKADIVEMCANVTFHVRSDDVCQTRVEVSDVSVGSSFLPFMLQELAPVREAKTKHMRLVCLQR